MTWRWLEGGVLAVGALNVVVAKRRLTSPSFSDTSIRDAGHRAFPPNRSIPEEAPHVVCLVMLVLAWVSVCRSTKRRARFLRTLLVLLTLRVVCIHLTVLPAPREFRPAPSSLLGGLYSHASRDYIFSGHTTLVVASALALASSSSTAWRAPVVLVAVVAVQMYMLLALRWHYTVDVFVAAVLTVLVYHARFSTKVFVE